MGRANQRPLFFRIPISGAVVVPRHPRLIGAHGCAQVNSFNESSSNDSLPGQFMKWADEKMTWLGDGLWLASFCGHALLDLAGFWLELYRDSDAFIIAHSIPFPFVIIAIIFYSYLWFLFLLHCTLVIFPFSFPLITVQVTDPPAGRMYPVCILVYLPCTQAISRQCFLEKGQVLVVNNTKYYPCCTSLFMIGVYTKQQHAGQVACCFLIVNDIMWCLQVVLPDW